MIAEIATRRGDRKCLQLSLRDYNYLLQGVIARNHLILASELSVNVIIHPYFLVLLLIG